MIINTSDSVTLEELGGMSKTVIWENTSPESNFPAQKVSINTEPYDFIEIEILGGVPNAVSSRGDGIAGSIQMMWARATNAFFAERYYQVYNGSIQFDDAYQQSIKPQLLEAFMLNSRCKPNKIYGLKGVK